MGRTEGYTWIIGPGESHEHRGGPGLSYEKPSAGKWGATEDPTTHIIKAGAIARKQGPAVQEGAGPSMFPLQLRYQMWGRQRIVRTPPRVEKGQSPR